MIPTVRGGGDERAAGVVGVDEPFHQPVLYGAVHELARRVEPHLEVLGDLLGSAGVIVAAIVIYTTGWPYADPIVGAAIGLFILPRTWTLTAQALRILMQVAPPGMDVEEIRRRIIALPDVLDVHDLHVWTLTSGLENASGHVVVADGADYHDVLDRVLALLADDYGITHVTVQCEPAHHEERDTPV